MSDSDASSSSDASGGSVAPWLRAAAAWLHGAVVRRAAVDLRALAAFRIALGLLVVFDVLMRARYIGVFYTDDGVLPRSYVNAALSEPYSLHALSGSVEFQAFLFVLTGLAALAVMVGYRSRVAIALTWILVLSVHNRNYVVTNAGDNLLRILLFWAIFLPIGARWSVDALRLEECRWLDADVRTVASIGSAGVLVQVVIVYAANAIDKLRSDEWVNGNAVPVVMHDQQLTVYLGPLLTEVPWVLEAMNYAWLGLVIVSPLLLLLTGWPRSLLAAGFLGMHAGMFLTMQIGIFPLVSIAGLIVFLHPGIWDRLERWGSHPAIGGAAADSFQRLHRLDPIPSLRELGYPETGTLLSEGKQALSIAVPLLFVPLVIWSATASVGYAPVNPANPTVEQLNGTPLEPVGDGAEYALAEGVTALDHTEMDQAWGMFAPHPLSISRYYVVRGNLTDGTRVSPFPGATAGDPPPNPAESVRSERWRKYITHVQYNTPTNHPYRFGTHICERWNRVHDTTLANVTVYAVQEGVSPNGSVRWQRRDQVVGTYECDGDFIQAN